MPHQCVHCGKMYEDAAPELLKGCTNCDSHFFFFVRKQQLDELKEKTIELAEVDKEQVEKDVREMIGLEEEKDVPVILDLESIRTAGPGKFEIDIVNLFSKKRPLIYKLEEGKYIIDLASTLKVGLDEIRKKIKRPEE
jgi:predicted  nucleic acid-binding Zn-ribbon protein